MPKINIDKQLADVRELYLKEKKENEELKIKVQMYEAIFQNILNRIDNGVPNCCRECEKRLG